MIKSFWIWLKSHKLLAITALVLIVVSLIAYFVFIRPKTAVPSPTPSAILRETLKNPSVFPAPGEIEIGGTKNPISLFFSVPVNEKTLAIETSPTIQMRVSFLPDSPNRIILEPITEWKENQTYEITIKKGLISLSGEEELKYDFSFKYQVLKQDTTDFITPL